MSPDAADFRASHLRFWASAGETVTDETAVVLVCVDLCVDDVRG